MHLDLFWALRWLRKDPFFASAIVSILALGIGANTAVFSIVDAVLLRPSPYPSAERLMRIDEGSTSRALSGVPIKDYQRWANRHDIFEEIAPYSRDVVTLTGNGEPEQVTAVRSWRLFQVLRIPARLGRTLIASDDEQGRETSQCLAIGCGAGAITRIRA